MLHHHNSHNWHHWTGVILGTTALKHGTHHSHCWQEGEAGRVTLWLGPAAGQLYWTLLVPTSLILNCMAMPSDWVLQRCLASLSALPGCGKYRIHGSCHVSLMVITSILTGSAHLGVITQGKGNNKQNWPNHSRIMQKIITHSREHQPDKKKTKFPLFFFSSSFPFRLFPTSAILSFCYWILNSEAVTAFLKWFSFNCQLSSLFLHSHFLPRIFFHSFLLILVICLILQYSSQYCVYFPPSKNQKSILLHLL